MPNPDFIVIGAGSAGCIAATRLAEMGHTVTLLEAGPTHRHPLVKMPMGLAWTMGKPARDWCFRTTPQPGLNGRDINVPRGKMVGGSGSINSMVWFRGLASDFDGWNLPSWGWENVVPAFEQVEYRLQPQVFTGAHPLTRNIYKTFAANSDTPPHPDRESFGTFRFNMTPGRRRSSADAFLNGAPKAKLALQTGAFVDRIGFENGQAKTAHLVKGPTLTAGRGVVLCAGAIASPAILMRSGVGPAAQLQDLGIDVLHDAPGVGQNLHDHPGVGLHHAGDGSGYGLTLDQLPGWALAPIQILWGKGRFASPTVEGGGFFNARGDGGPPDVQTHFIPFILPWPGKTDGKRGSGYFVDVCLSRPKSRGDLKLASADPTESPLINLGIFQDPSDLDTMVAGVKRLRDRLSKTDLGRHQAPEVYPGPTVTDGDIQNFIRDNAGTAYHPVGTLRMGDGDAPVAPDLSVKGVNGLWVADASVMPNVTSANTNAPSMMIGYRGAQMIHGAVT
ncbi:MAG: GMC oxidoreductase [Pseudomonadota bacterium]